ncbi:hypothetical protein [Nocardia fluminea]|uniref:hypothetical protein n=1 Tax=Nocardia fluminea TaxID=134984 RepID=UPI003661854D
MRAFRRRFHSGGIAFASTPTWPDDDEFHAAWNAEANWTGHWYSRERAEARGLPEPETA